MRRILIALRYLPLCPLWMLVRVINLTLSFASVVMKKADKKIETIIVNKTHELNKKYGTSK